MSTDDYRRDSSSTYSSSEHRSQKPISPPPRRYEEPIRPKEVAPKEKPKPVAVARNNNQVNIQRSEKTNKHNDVELESDRRQLHKVVKITYKDGTVALKSVSVATVVCNVENVYEYRIDDLVLAISVQLISCWFKCE